MGESGRKRGCTNGMRCIHRTPGLRGWELDMCTSHITWTCDHKGIEAAYNEACKTVREQAAEMDSLWQSRFFERRTLDNGTKKLWPTTEGRISRAHDLQDLDGEPIPDFLYCDDDGELYPVTVGKADRPNGNPDGPDQLPFAYASSDMIANGKVVGHVLYTDH